MLALDVRPLPAVRVSGQAYARSFTDLLLIAPVEGGPFATVGFVNGSGRARGIALEAALAAPLEWEACQLLDQGCEFGGSPDHTGEPLGGTTLPTYLCVDVGLRKHWHARLAGRDELIAAFGSVTNVLGAGNVLTYGPDPVTGVRVPLEMHPRAPLVVGMDLRF